MSCAHTARPYCQTTLFVSATPFVALSVHNIANATQAFLLARKGARGRLALSAFLREWRCYNVADPATA